MFRWVWRIPGGSSRASASRCSNPDASLHVAVLPPPSRRVAGSADCRAYMEAGGLGGDRPPRRPRPACPTLHPPMSFAESVRLNNKNYHFGRLEGHRPFLLRPQNLQNRRTFVRHVWGGCSSLLLLVRGRTRTAENHLGSRQTRELRLERFADASKCAGNIAAASIDLKKNRSP